MKNRTRKLIYRAGFAVTLAAGCAVSLLRLLPVQNTAVFLFGLLWLWEGVTLLFKINLTYVQDVPRKLQLLFAAMAVALGASWGVISLSPLSHRGLPMLLVSLPFLALGFLMYLRRKNT